MENLTTKERLQKFVAEMGYGRNKFEHYVGISSGYLSSKSISITSDVIEKIIDKFPQLNIYWLLTGEGSMRKTTPDENVVSEPQAAYGDTGLLKEVQELKKRVKELEEIIKKKDDYINGQKDLLRISDASINTLKESLSDKNMIIDLLNEKVDSLSSVKRKSTLK